MSEAQQGDDDVPVDIPISNRARGLPRATESALGQTWLAIEIFNVDDGSEYVAETVVGGLSGPIRYLKQEDRGGSQARNRGMAVVDGFLIASVDTDDHWHPRKLGLQLAAMGGGGAAWCATKLSMADSAETPLPGTPGLAGAVSVFRDMGMQTGEWSCTRLGGITLNQPEISIFFDDAETGP